MVDSSTHSCTHIDEGIKETGKRSICRNRNQVSIAEFLMFEVKCKLRRRIRKYDVASHVYVCMHSKCKSIQGERVKGKNQKWWIALHIRVYAYIEEGIKEIEKRST